MVYNRSVFLSFVFLLHPANGTRNMRLIDLVFLSSFSTRNVPFSSHTLTVTHSTLSTHSYYSYYSLLSLELFIIRTFNSLEAVREWKISFISHHPTCEFDLRRIQSLLTAVTQARSDRTPVDSGYQFCIPHSVNGKHSMRLL